MSTNGVCQGGQCLVEDMRGFRPPTIRGRRPLG